MRMIRPPFRRLLVLGVLAAVGCTGDDADRLARIGKKTLDRAQALAGDPEGKLIRSLEALRGKADDGQSLPARVTARLRWDKLLADTPIEVTADGAVIELRGKLRNLDQRRRAVELAESTAGVDKVTDGLEVPAADP